MDNVVDQEYSKKAVDTYDKFFGAEVCLSDDRGRKMMTISTRSVKDNEGNHRGIEHPTLFSDRSLYEVSFPNGRTE